MNYYESSDLVIFPRREYSTQSRKAWVEYSRRGKIKENSDIQSCIFL